MGMQPSELSWNMQELKCKGPCNRIADSSSTGKIVEKAKELNPNICVIVKVHDLQEMKRLNSMGADEIIPEEYETSVEILSACLKNTLSPGKY